MSMCRGCGKEIVWGKNEFGKKIPLDPRAPVYIIEGVIIPGDFVPVSSAKTDSYQTAMVSHFATCPDANRFSASKKKSEGRPDSSARVTDDSSAPHSER